ncbi:Pyridoxal phosphate-dependent decarboxylase [Cordyceps fumosorosea ARSEF 2679]|uniref:Pyridoxal phosphate-dependent decarboxylase n=1 Tax=Cordyceps fumosorosea (strain ARSEF 2679) TaxID=1081104 RepID=A0A168E392_CORFA|nr:Pyridoxal phosphate-dependent decarboxylase [Cordyceps fumosorosea ARSEF 2679]OAA73325.1 Pyridoxal phosphate-dependent decarboxylase [Cordyceps fumosorosea ARSEF 2679]
MTPPAATTYAQNGNSSPATAATTKPGAGSGPGSSPLNRAGELEHLLQAVQQLILPFVRAADDAAAEKPTGAIPKGRPNVLVQTTAPAELAAKLDLVLPAEGQGADGLLLMIRRILDYSVNTWDQGFLDKLYASNTPVGVISDIILSILNTNLHVYQVSPALTVIEKATGRALARLFGFEGDFAGGITCQGGSSSNLTSLVVARNTLYPETKSRGVAGAGRDFVVFTSAHGHYSVEKSAMICGLGADGVWAVPVDDEGRMRVAALRELVAQAKTQGKTPLYVNATAGTTVRGSYESFAEISAVCKEHGMWMHIDASWGGPVVFSRAHRHKLAGAHLADSITINPHKMMSVPTTCSYLLVPDTRTFKVANSTKAGYLFHEGSGEDGETWDLADLTLQCGRRGDSLKLALAWLYYGADGFERQIDHAFAMASLLHARLEATGNFALLSGRETPCLQVCFYYAPGGALAADKAVNTERTRRIVHALIERGFMVDYAPGDRGSFLRVVVNVQTLPGTVGGLAKALDEVAAEGQ